MFRMRTGQARRSDDPRAGGRPPAWRRWVPPAVVSMALVALLVTPAVMRAAGGPTGIDIARTNDPIQPDRGGRVVDVTLESYPVEWPVADGQTQVMWTFNGQVPGPVVRVRQGDVVRFTLVNRDPRLPHSADLHAARTPWDRDFRDVPPGKSLQFYWKAEYPGVWMYHCGTQPVILHIGNGMFGVVIVDPKEGRLPAREFVLVQHEIYGGPNDLTGMLADTPKYVAFNGERNRYAASPLQARPGELIRLYVVDAGPNRSSAFHVVGTIFDRVEVNGNPRNTLYGIQTYTVPPGGGSVFELRIPEEGRYPVVTHAFNDATAGALGILEVRKDAPAASPAPDALMPGVASRPPSTD
ncbi:multicopper oxidase domain-containing protein [Limnochorda pilosa]|uniref:Copper-containing nitrite reductase n=1 Tax=Limnochorda pilosa TaxID=1555112 RepID=A0A0K2SPW9_LIMPI|nr:multicopper oxidase domain-containing protein [Limnochorda pilosa]BAS29158.1 nitrite reductase [Limnochorda pilosa]